MKEELLGLATHREVTELELTTSISVNDDTSSQALVATEVVGQEPRDGAPSLLHFESQECTLSKVIEAVPVVETLPKVEKILVN